MFQIRLRKRTAVAVTAVALGLVSGCGGEDPGSTGSDSQGSESTPTAEPSRSAPAPVADGTTTLDLGRRVDLLLAAAGVEVAPVGAATESGEGIAMPVADGDLGIEPVAGSLRHEGGLSFTAAGRSAEATALELDAGSGEVTAEIAGERVPLLTAEFEPPRLSDDGSSVVLPGRRATLSEQAVGQLNDALGVDLLTGGLEIGELTVEATWP